MQNPDDRQFVERHLHPDGEGRTLAGDDPHPFADDGVALSPTIRELARLGQA